MKSAVRRSARTSAGDKNRASAELESTPKTLRPFDTTPGKRSVMDELSRNSEDGRIKLRNKRLQWRNVPDPSDGDHCGENIPYSSQTVNLHYDVHSKGTVALSPICLNAVNVSPECPSLGKKFATGKFALHSPRVSLSSSTKNCASTKHSDKATDRNCAVRTLDQKAHDHEEDGNSTDTGSNASSPCFASRGKKLSLWNNPTFNKKTASQSMDSASPGSSYSVSTCQVKPSCSERQISEVQSRLVEKDESASFESCQMNSKRKSAVLRQGTDGMDPMLSQSPSNFASVEARFMKGLSDCKDGHDRAGLMGNSCCRNEARIATNISKTEYEMDSLSTVALSSGNLRAARHTQMQAGLAIGNPEEEMTYGLGELQREIDRLTERLAELHLQKKKREEQILRLRQEKCDKIIIPDKRGIERDDKQPRAEIEISTRSACAGHSSGMSQTYKLNNVAQKARALSPADSAVRRAAQTPIKRQRKLSELRRSVSSTARRIERSSSNEQMKVPRRLSMSAALASDSDLKQQQQNFRSMSSKSSQCRVVPSRYGRAITPDACRPPATSSTKKILSKRTDNSFAPASFPSPSASLTCNPSRKASTPRNGYPSRSSVSISTLDRQAKELLYAVSSSDQILPSTLTSPLTKSEHRALATSEDRGLIKAEDSAALTSASLTCSPSRKASTPRNGYPSRSGFSTPANDRRAMELKCSVSSSMQNLPSTLTSQIIKPEDRTRLLQSPRCMSPRPRLDSPKTTAALYKCLESLLEDSKHFFKHLSPRRSRGLFRLGQDSIAASNPSSVSVQGISAKEIVSPRSQFR